MDMDLCPLGSRPNGGQGNNGGNNNWRRGVYTPLPFSDPISPSLFFAGPPISKVCYLPAWELPSFRPNLASHLLQSQQQPAHKSLWPDSRELVHQVVQLTVLTFLFLATDERVICEAGDMLAAVEEALHDFTKRFSNPNRDIVVETAANLCN